MVKGDNMIETLEDLYDFYNGMINIISDRVPLIKILPKEEDGKKVSIKV